ncbi:MAG: RluA family pseudouridine synthase [Clostridia bacterium]|nr:RluA family pseudouridine synthase [Clostridia bacterium]
MMDSPGFEILYEDNHMMGVVKPCGILSQGNGEADEDMLTMIASYIKIRDQKPGNVFVGLVHRLDRNVGGTMVFAKTSKGASRLSESMRNGQFDKGYFALTKTPLSQPGGVLVHSLWKDPRQNQVFERPEGKLSKLGYRFIGQAGGYYLYYAVPITGRTHQIRAQFAFTGSPLVGDSKYGQASSGKGLPIGLWSGVVSVPHPVRRDERILLTSVPTGEPWCLHPDILPLIRSFVEKGDFRWNLN